MSQNEEFADFEIDINVEQVDAWGGEQRPLVPAGDYLLTITGFKQDKAEQTGNPYIAVTFDVAEGEYTGHKVYNNYVLTEKAMGRIKSLMLACKTELSRIVAAQFMGVTIKASIVHVEGAQRVDNNGNPMPVKTFANVVNEQPLDDEPAKQATPTKAPPVTKTAASKTNSAGAARRA